MKANSKEFELKLIRYSNQSCYLFGNLFNEEEFLCDTLEFGSGVQLPVGRYRIESNISNTSSMYPFYIFDNENNKVSSITTADSWIYCGFKLRIESSDIQVGCKLDSSKLVMHEYSTKVLRTLILGYIHKGYTCFINISENF